jgi:probable phosphoglycerate mutase
MRAYFVRHGESEANVLEVISNRGSVHGLTMKGRQQAELLADQLKREPIAYLFCSPLLRAVETAEILGEAFGLSPTINDGLREFDCGRIEGRGDPEAWEIFRTLVRKWMVDGNYEARIPGGESYLDIQARFFGMIESRINTLDASRGNVLLVGHGMVYYLMLPLLFSDIDHEFAHGHRIGNTAFAIGKGSVGRWNCQAWFGAVPPGASPGE